jgi:hypothetical protein
MTAELLGVLQSFIEAGVLEKIGNDEYRWAAINKRTARKNYWAWCEANPERAARLTSLAEASRINH